MNEIALLQAISRIISELRSDIDLRNTAAELRITGIEKLLGDRDPLEMTEIAPLLTELVGRSAETIRGMAERDLARAEDAIERRVLESIPDPVQGPRGDPGQTPNYRGTYDPEETYGLFDAVIWKGSGFISTADAPGDLPGDDWRMTAQRGGSGARGKDGLDGLDGKDGRDGKDGATGPSGAIGPKGVDGRPGKDAHAGIWRGKFEPGRHCRVGEIYSHAGGPWMCVEDTQLAPVECHAWECMTDPDEESTS